VIGTTIEEQTAATLEKFGRVLRSFGATFDNVVKATVHLSDVANAPRFNAVYARYFPNNKPVRTLTGSQLNGVLVEVGCGRVSRPDNDKLGRVSGGLGARTCCKRTTHEAFKDHENRRLAHETSRTLPAVEQAEFAQDRAGAT